MSGHAEPSHWRRFALTFLAVSFGLVTLLYAFVVALDPFGTRADARRGASPIMDLNQRFMYPQLVRSRRFDAAVFGTSTVRLLDPVKLGAAFGARFVNLGLNAGTPWEQMQLADLFLRHVPQPKALIFGLDRTWCEEDADRKRLTFRAFPPWLYDEDRLNDYPELFNLKSLEIAGRLALHRLGLMPERVRGDGYEVFVPDESAYDLARARFHLHGGEPQPWTRSAGTPLRPEERKVVHLPALEWLDVVLARVPGTTPVTLTMLPIHVVWQARPGTREGELEAECKAQITELGRRHGAIVVDFRLPSPVTTEDSNYWDPLHYRVGIADRIVAALIDARSGREAPDGFYRLLSSAER